jgi:hypothetical protein
VEDQSFPRSIGLQFRMDVKKLLQRQHFELRTDPIANAVRKFALAVSIVLEIVP